MAAPDGRTVVSIDTQVADQDFRLQWNNGYRTSGYDVGWKAAAQNLSDINAMGARATSMVVSLTMPPETLVSWVEDFADGMSAGIRELGARRLRRGRRGPGPRARTRRQRRHPGHPRRAGPGAALRRPARGTPWRWPAPWDAPPPAWPCWNPATPWTH